MNADELFDQAVAAVRDEPIDPQTTAQALSRVERRLAAELAAEPAAAPAEETSEPTHRIRGCEGFRELLPAYQAGALSEPKRLLVEDHLRECVPCRRALAELRRGASVASPAAPARPSRHWRPGRLALAATLAGLVVGGLLAARSAGLFAPEVTARVRSIEGELVAVDGGKTRPIAAGETIRPGELVRTAAGSGALLELADGSRLELAERSELALDRRRDGAVLELGRGAVIVEAAQQKRGHLYVSTDDCLVSVVGTIFSVNHGVRGSRVAVLDGEVRVAQGARFAVLRPGEQLATNAQLTRVSLEQEIAWSQNAPAYRERIAALAALGRELDATLATPGTRTSTRLLDLAPAGTAIWVGLPNVADQLAGAWSLVERRVAENPALGAWWSERMGVGDAQEIGAAIDELREFAGHLGPEIAVAVGFDATGRPGAPLLLAEVADERGFDALIDGEIEKLNARAQHGGRLVRVEDPKTAAVSDGDTLLVWRAPSGLFVATPSAARLREFAEQVDGGAFAATPFRARMAQAYADGAGWLLGVDLTAVKSRVDGDAGASAAFAALGLGGAQHFLLESETVEGINETRATVGFAGERRGMASWLATPAPSRALEFVSPDAQLAVAGLTKSPAAMFDDLLAAARAKGAEQATAKLAEVESALGLSLRDDLAASLGGDFAIALDGPVLPKPSWKLVVELADPSRFDFALGRLVEVANAEAAKQGQPGLRLAQEEADGRLYQHLSTEAGADLAFLTQVDGYLLAAPSRALLVETIARRAAGAHLAASRAFLSRLPSDGDPNFSAVVWQNLGGLASSLGQLFGGSNLAPEAQAELEAMTRDAGPSLIVAYGEPDRVRLVARGAHGPLGFSFEKLLALAGALRSGTSAPASPVAVETPVRATA